MPAKLMVMLLYLSLCLVMMGAADSNRRQSNQRHNGQLAYGRQTRSVRDGISLQYLMNAVERDDHMEITEQYMNFTPSTPAPENINCWVEVPTTRVVGGRCVQLGRRGRSARNRPWACQAGLHLAIMSPDCQRYRTRSGRRRNWRG